MWEIFRQVTFAVAVMISAIAEIVIAVIANVLAIHAFMMTFEEHCTLLYYLKPSLYDHSSLLVKCPSEPSFIVLRKPFPDKTDSFSAA